MSALEVPLFIYFFVENFENIYKYFFIKESKLTTTRRLEKT